jgi:hypothetical protein
LQGSGKPFGKYPLGAFSYVVLISVLSFAASILALVTLTRYFPAAEAEAYNLLGIKFSLLQLVIAMILAATLQTVLIYLAFRRQRQPRAGREPRTGSTAADSRSGRSDRVLRLTRSAERLHRIEEDLIRKIADDYPTDKRTQRLLTEMQICTNRILVQLGDLQQPGTHGGGGKRYVAIRRGSSTPVGERTVESPAAASAGFEHDIT